MENVRGSLKSRVPGKKNRVHGGGVVEKLKSSPGEEKYGGQWVPAAASKGLCGAAAAWYGSGGAAAASTTIAFTLTHRADPQPWPVHRSSPCTAPSCVYPATTCRRSVAMDTRNDVTDNTPHQSRPAPPPVTIATQGDGSGGCGVASGWWEPCVKTAHGIMFPKKKIKLIVYLLYDSILRPYVQLLALHSAHPARQPSRRHHCSSFFRRQRAKPSPRVTSILWWWSEGGNRA